MNVILLISNMFQPTHVAIFKVVRIIIQIQL